MKSELFSRFSTTLLRRLLCFVYFFIAIRGTQWMIIFNVNIFQMHQTNRSTIYNIPRYRSDLAEQQKLDSYIGTYLHILYGNAFRPVCLLCQILKTCCRRRWPGPVIWRRAGIPRTVIILPNPRVFTYV